METTVMTWRVKIIGTFALYSPNGLDATPKSRKSQAIIAMLVLSDDGRLTRKWFQSQLWSTRSHEQASASLRQALAEIRRLELKFKPLIGADRSSIWILKGTFTLDPVRKSSDSTEQLLQGLITRDPVFDNWLIQKRKVLSELPEHVLRSEVSNSKKAHVVETPGAVVRFEGGNNQQSFAAMALQQQVAKNLKELGLSCTLVSNQTQVISKPGTTALIAIQDDSTFSGKNAITATLVDAANNRYLWSHSHIVEHTENCLDSEIWLQFAAQCTDTVSTYIGNAGDACPVAQSTALLQLAVREILSFEPAKLNEAEELLCRAEDLFPNPVHLAWRSYLLKVKYAERLSVDKVALEDTSDIFLNEALTRDPDNSLVLAIASQVKSTLNGDYAAANCLADEALALNRGNPLAHDSASMVAERQGRSQDSLEHARLACHIGSRSLMRHQYQMGYALALIRSGKFESAVKSAELALSRSPNYRPPLRHLYALYLYFKETESASLRYRQLARLEPGFSLESLRQNSSYPAEVLRHSPLIDLADLDGVSS